MSGGHSPGRRRARRRPALLLWQPSVSVGALLLLLAVAVSLLLLRREIEVLTDLTDDPDAGDWPISHLQLRTADAIPLEGGGEEERAAAGGKERGGEREGEGRGRGGGGGRGGKGGKGGGGKEGGGGVRAGSGVGGDGKGDAGNRGRGRALEDGGGFRGGRLREMERWEKERKGRGEAEKEAEDVTKEDKRIAQDVTIIISGKHSFAMAQMHLEEVLKSSPLVRVIYAMSGPMDNNTRRYLLEKESQCSRLELVDAGLFASGYSSRNASLDRIKTKYGLFIFNDVMPANRKWLHELHAFAENCSDGDVFAPFIWERHRMGTGIAGGSSSVENSRIMGGAAAAIAGESEWPLQPHVGFTRELSFDDYSNDGKLYINLAESERKVEPGGLAAREVDSFLEDHCLLVRRDFLREAVLWDTLAGFTRQDVELALTLRYEKRKAFFVPQSEVIYQHPSVKITPADLPFFASQSCEDTCAENLVQLRRKWGIITGQLCRGFIDGVLRRVVWGEKELPVDQGEQTRLLVAMFTLMGLNRFQMRFLQTWVPPPRGPPIRCKSRNRKNCPHITKWMESGSDSVGMLTALPRIEAALTELHAQVQAGIATVNASRGGPQLWMGRVELQLPLRLNKVKDSQRAYALQSGDLFGVRRGMVKRGDKHAGRKAPELPMLTRLYLPFLLIEFELMLSKGGSRGLEAEQGLGRVMDGMSIVIQEHCVREGDGSEGAQQKGYLLMPGGRPCHRNEQHYRAWMYVRHLERDPSPQRMFMTLRHRLLRGTDVQPGGWVDGQSIRRGLAEPLQDVLKRLRVVACVAGSAESCSLALPMGAQQRAWRLLLWTWRPQSVRTAQVLLLKPDMAQIAWQR